jgi:hypothetical protein
MARSSIFLILDESKIETEPFVVIVPKAFCKGNFQTHISIKQIKLSIKYRQIIFFWPLILKLKSFCCWFKKLKSVLFPVIINVLIPALLFESKIVLNSVVGWYKIKTL